MKKNNGNVLNILSDNIAVNICNTLAEFRGGSPIQLAMTIGINPKIIAGKIKELDSYGLIKKDENEIKEFGDIWAFYSLTNKGYRTNKMLSNLMNLLE